MVVLLNAFVHIKIKKKTAFNRKIEIIEIIPVSPNNKIFLASQISCLTSNNNFHYQKSSKYELLRQIYKSCLLKVFSSKVNETLVLSEYFIKTTYRPRGYIFIHIISRIFTSSQTTARKVCGQREITSKSDICPQIQDISSRGPFELSQGRNMDTRLPHAWILSLKSLTVVKLVGKLRNSPPATDIEHIFIRFAVSETKKRRKKPQRRQKCVGVRELLVKKKNVQM